MSEEHKNEHPDENEPMPEGEETAPPLMRTMGIVRWVLLGAMTLFALVMVLSYFNMLPGSANASADTKYHCPMHPTYVSNQPGDCPICGMSLVEIGSSADEPVDTANKQQSLAMPGQYTCPMDPEVVSDTAGRCPKCNMFLEKVPEFKEQYSCPMHPEVVSDTPGQCPKCGMDLVLVQSSSSTGSQSMANMSSSSVPGHASVTIEASRLQLIGVRVETVEMRRLSSRHSLVGFITPDESRVTNAHLRVSGWVQKLFVNQTGEFVRKGDPLLSVYSQELLEAEEDFLQAMQNSSKSSGDSILAITRTELADAARERLALLGLSNEQIDRLSKNGVVEQALTISSPLSGVVLEKSVFEGGFVSPNQNLFTIADLSTLWLIADVYERDLSSIKIGDQADVTVDALPSETFEATIRFVYPVVSAETRTAKVRIVLANPESKLRPGMYGTATVRTEQEKVLAISPEALMDDGELQYAFVVHDGTHFEPRLLQIGDRSDNWVEIVSGLSEGEVVVSSANFLIDSESRLKAAISGMGGTSDDPHSGHTN